MTKNGGYKEEIMVEDFSGKKVPGLKELRKSRERKPSYTCENCKCIRYTPCTCIEKKKTEAQDRKDG